MRSQKKDFINQTRVNILKFSISKNAPLFKSYNNSKYFIKFLGIKNYSFLNFIEKKKSFLIYTTENKFGLDAFTPIHFQNYIDDNYLQKNLLCLKNFFLKKNYISFYIQSKNYIESNFKNINTERFRTNYYINLNQSEKKYYFSMNKLSKRLLNKINIKNFVLSKSKITLDFIKYYNLLAKNKNLSDNYIYKNSKWKLLDKCDDILFYKLLDLNNNYLFGGLFGVDGREIDYLYGCNSFKNDSGSRIFFMKIFKELKKSGFKKLYLGGGVYEGDGLSRFKMSIGGVSQKCCTIRCITDEKKAIELNLKKSNFFTNFFPPYK